MRKIKRTICAIISAGVISAGLLSVYAYEDMSANLQRIVDYYNNGYFYEMLDEISWARQMDLSPEDIAILDQYEEIGEYCASNVDAIYAEFSRAQSYCDQGLYYEASAVLDNVAATYSLTQSQWGVWSAKKADANAGLERWVARSSAELNRYLGTHHAGVNYTIDVDSVTESSIIFSLTAVRSDGMRIADTDRITASLSGRSGSFNYTDSRGNRGTGTISLGDGYIVVNVNYTSYADWAMEYNNVTFYV